MPGVSTTAARDLWITAGDQWRATCGSVKRNQEWYSVILCAIICCNSLEGFFFVFCFLCKIYLTCVALFCAGCLKSQVLETMANKIGQQVRGRRLERDHHGRFVRRPRREPYPVSEHPTDGEVQIETGSSAERKGAAG